MSSKNDADPTYADEGIPTRRLARRLTSATTSLALRPPPTVARRDADVPAHASPPSLPLLHDLIAGGVAGSCGIVVGHPLDSLKVRMQTMSAGSLGAAGGTGVECASVAELARGARFAGAWNGLGAPLAAAAIVNATIFLTYGGATRLWDRHFDDRPFARSAACGGAAGMASSLILCPSEHVKTKLQTQQRTTHGNGTYRGSFHAAKQIFARHGTVGLYRGFVATLVRQVPGFVVYFGTYDRLKDWTIANCFDTRHTLLASILSGGVAGSLSWAAVYPADLIKSRIQALPMDCVKRERSVIAIARGVVRGHGWRALYRGLGVTVMRAFPVNGIIFPTYEFTLKALRGR